MITKHDGMIFMSENASKVMKNKYIFDIFSTLFHHRFLMSGIILDAPWPSWTLLKAYRSFLHYPWTISRKVEKSWKSWFVGSWKKSFLQKEIRSSNRIEATDAFLDRSWPKVQGKIAQKSNEFIENEISSLGARGKPSTFVYRAEWLVEPSLIIHIDLCYNPSRGSHSLCSFSYRFWFVAL